MTPVSVTGVALAIVLTGCGIHDKADQAKIADLTQQLQTANARANDLERAARLAQVPATSTESGKQQGLGSLEDDRISPQAGTSADAEEAKAVAASGQADVAQSR